MKKEKIILSILGASVILGASPIIASADYTINKGNIAYTYNTNQELISAKFREGQLVADPGATANKKYTPKYEYGDSNLVRKVSSDMYGQKYTYMLPDGYYNSSLRENREYSNTDNCYVSTSGQSGNNFKPYSQKYISGNGCNANNFNNGGTFSYNGQSGEWRILGYNSYGDSSVENPVFPYDYQVSQYPNQYPWIDGVGYKTEFDKAFYRDEKLTAIEGAMKLYGLTGNPNDWVNKLSLQTDPTSDTPIFRGQRNNGFYRTVHAPTKTTLTRDLSITKFEVLYKNEVIGIFTRDSSGNVNYDVKKNVASANTYTFRVTVQNSSDADMDSNQLKVQLGYALGSNAGLSDQLEWFDKDNQKIEVTGNKLKKGESTTLSSSVHINQLDQGTSYRATAVLDKNHYTRQNPDSVDKSNDWGKLLFNVDNGNITAIRTELIDKNGNVVTHAPIPGEMYKIRYHYKYSGLDRDSDFDLEFNNIIVRTLNNGNTDTYKQTVNKKISELVPKHSDDTYLKNGDTFNVETPYITFETSEAQTSSTLTQNVLVDNTSSDNTTSDNYSDIYDISIENVRIYPKTEMPTSYPARIKVGIKYDVIVTAPDYVPDFELDVVSQINANTSFIDHVKKGYNKDITREIEIILNGTGDLPAIVHVNKPSDPNQRIWETDYTNNQGSTKDTIGTDGRDGSLSVIEPENPNNGGCTLGGVNNDVSFTKTHEFNDYYGNYIGTDKYGGTSSAIGKSGFYKYQSGQIHAENRNYNESYKIETVKFKSKLTTDLKLGNDGWVDLKGNDAKIKAGYGYDLKIVVNYRTNAITNQPTIVQNPNNPLIYHGKNIDDMPNMYRTSNGRFVNNLNVMANIPRDVYLKTQDGKVFSASGIYGTTKAFTARELVNDSETIKVEYTLINGGKIYIDEATKDGEYGLSIFTPNVSGISGQNLCDKANYTLEVKGSMLDDNNEHLVQ